MPPPAPLIVSVKVPFGVVVAVVMVTVDDPEPPVTVAGLKLAVAPVGKPLALRLTFAVNPFTAARVTV